MHFLKYLWNRKEHEGAEKGEMCKMSRCGVWKETGSYRTYSIPGKTDALVPEFAVEDLPSAKLQPRFLRLQWMTCPWAEHSDDKYVCKVFCPEAGPSLDMHYQGSTYLSLLDKRKE